jgi:hypothetical protein
LPWLHSLLYLPLWIGFWFIPDGFFNVYLMFCFWISGLYLVVQMIYLVNLFHTLNATLVQHSQFCYVATLTGILSFLSAGAFGVCY